jgi:hypothetical protein
MMWLPTRRDDIELPIAVEIVEQDRIRPCLRPEREKTAEVPEPVAELHDE